MAKVCDDTLLELQKEHFDISSRIEMFDNSDSIELDDVQSYLVEKQLKSMKAYDKVLLTRILLYQNKNKKVEI